jgi:hypothetical protein
VEGQSSAPIGLHKIDASSDWLLIKHHSIGMKGCIINRTTAAIGMILAFTGKKMFYFNLKSEGPPKKLKNQPRKKANICQFASTLLKSIS